MNIPDILAGCILCIFGWTIYWIGLHAVGAALGGMIGSMTGLGLAVVVDKSHQWVLPIAAAGALVGGMIGFFLIKRAHRFAFFIIGAISGAIAMIVGEPALAENITVLKDSPALQAVCVVVGSLALGVVLAIFNRYLIIIATALLGTMFICIGAGQKAAVTFIPIFLLSLILQGFLFHRYCVKSKKPGAGGAAPAGGGGGRP